jgi:outer membrane protein assembly factor BamB
MRYLFLIPLMVLAAASRAPGAPPAATPGAASGDWATWRGPQQDSIAADANWDPAKLSAGPKILWQANVGNGWGAVAVKGDSVYALGNRNGQDTVVCLKAADGSEVWKHTYPCPQGGDGYPGPRATPVVDADSVYTLSRDGQVLCIEAAQGKVKWETNLAKEFQAKAPRWGFASSACLVDGNRVLFNANTHGIALDRRTGKKVWASPPGVGNYAVPVLYQRQGRTVAAIFGQQDLFGVDPQSGQKLWSLPWKRDYDIKAAEPVVSGDLIFVTSGYGKGGGVFTLGGAAPKPLWQSKVLSCHFGSPILSEGHLYGLDGNAGGGRLKCVELKTGAEKWRQDVGFAQMLAAAGKLILLNERGELIVAVAQSTAYRELARAKVLDPKGGKCWTMPVLCRGRIYCRNSVGDLVAVDVAK